MYILFCEQVVHIPSSSATTPPPTTAEGAAASNERVLLSKSQKTALHKAKLRVRAGAPHSLQFRSESDEIVTAVAPVVVANESRLPLVKVLVLDEFGFVTGPVGKEKWCVTLGGGVVVSAGECIYMCVCMCDDAEDEASVYCMS